MSETGQVPRGVSAGAREPPGAPAVHMTWRRLLFLHWRVNTDALRPLIPPQLEIDEFDGSAWVGLVPFEMCDTRFRGWGWLPGLRRFHECNVRTYVRSGQARGQDAGVWFLSLEAANARITRCNGAAATEAHPSSGTPPASPTGPFRVRSRSFW
ncbi:MAG: DUF2071 domain-containing protein [Phycisphaerae bacterium]|nr:DUF2071 domain-containing protein [Phycisphaerae bacterium]